jgi:tRNA pseudouridine55 synthase
LNLNKPAGLTSHDCVYRVRKLLKIKRVGHGGTLDPAATGVLPIAIGKATRLLSLLPENKAYRALIRLGMTTNTDDLEGDVLTTHPGLELGLEDIQPILSKFIGEIEQIPPIYSAIQVNGQRLYKLARAGEQIEVPARKVLVRHLEILSLIPGEYPELEIAISCGPGTYIRAIARDLGKAFGVGGTLANLIRTESCGMEIADSITLEQLEAEIERSNLPLITPDLALKHFNPVILTELDRRKWCQGQTIAMESLNTELLESPQSMRVYQEQGHLLGIGELINCEEKLTLVPKIVFFSGN